MIHLFSFVFLFVGDAARPVMLKGVLLSAKDQYENTVFYIRVPLKGEARLDYQLVFLRDFEDEARKHVNKRVEVEGYVGLRGFRKYIAIFRLSGGKQ